jgi:hypothetical protein
MIYTFQSRSKSKKQWIVWLLLIPIFLTSCFGPYDDGTFVEYGSRVPVILDRTAFENSISYDAPTEMRISGKIYVKDDYVFVNDVNKGFHIYFYETPENPIPVGYLKIPGATDIAIRNNLLYINQAVDLVTMSFENNTFEVIHRVRNVFPQKTTRDAVQYELSPNEIVVDFVERL